MAYENRRNHRGSVLRIMHVISAELRYVWFQEFDVVTESSLIDFVSGDSFQEVKT